MDDPPAAHAYNCGILDDTACGWIPQVIDDLETSICPELAAILNHTWQTDGFRLTDFASSTQSGGSNQMTAEVWIDIDFVHEIPQILAHEAWHIINGDHEPGAYGAEVCVNGFHWG